MILGCGAIAAEFCSGRRLPWPIYPHTVRQLAGRGRAGTGAGYLIGMVAASGICLPSFYFFASSPASA